MNSPTSNWFGGLERLLRCSQPESKPSVSFQRYTGWEGEEKRREIIVCQPNIIFSSYVTLKLMVVQPAE